MQKDSSGAYVGFPFGRDAIGTNLYAWCANNPVNRVDPSGHGDPLSMLLGIGGAIVGGVIGFVTGGVAGAITGAIAGYGVGLSVGNWIENNGGLGAVINSTATRLAARARAAAREAADAAAKAAALVRAKAQSFANLIAQQGRDAAASQAKMASMAMNQQQVFQAAPPVVFMQSNDLSATDYWLYKLECSRANGTADAYDLNGNRIRFRDYQVDYQEENKRIGIATETAAYRICPSCLFIGQTGRTVDFDPGDAS